MPPRSRPSSGLVLIAGPSIDTHHLLPRSHGGKITVTLHRICHQAIDPTLSEAELARGFASIEALQQYPDLNRLIARVRKRPADYQDRSRWSRLRRRK